MSEFERELLNKVSPHDRTHNGNELFIGGVLAEHFKDWQPPKRLVEVPKFVADWFENAKGNLEFEIWQYISDWRENEQNDFWFWFSEDENKPTETLIRMKLEGYTVKEEKKYVLKHIDMSKLSTDDSLYLAHGVYEKLQHVTLSKDVDVHNIAQLHFTKSEIDELNIGSYEQIEVYQ